MNDLEIIFTPEESTNEDNIFLQLEKLKNALRTKQMSITLFTLLLDSLEKQGEVCRIAIEELKLEKEKELNFIVVKE